MLSNISGPLHYFTRLTIDEDVIIGRDYKRVIARASSFVQIGTDYGTISHFWSVQYGDTWLHLAGVEFFANNRQVLYGYPIITATKSELSYISISEICEKVNLFPIEENDICTGYWVAPACKN